MKDKGTKNNKCIRLVSGSSAPCFSKGDISLTEFAGRHICCQASFLGGISNTSRSWDFFGLLNLNNFKSMFVRGYTTMAGLFGDIETVGIAGECTLSRLKQVITQLFRKTTDQ